jgi:hypothetical protein
MDITGVFLEKLEMSILEKKNGRKKTRYMSPIDVQTNTSILLSSRSPVVRKNARIIIPAPARNNRNLKSED